MKMRKGFTLVELLIVIIIIGILAAAMLMSSGSATDAATASTAIAEMRALKAGVIMLIAERGGAEDLKTAADVTAVISMDGLARFMERPDEIRGKYEIKASANGETVSIEPKAGQFTGNVLDKIKKNKAVGAAGDMGFKIK